MIGTSGNTLLSRDELRCRPKGKDFQSRGQNYRYLNLCCDEIDENVDKGKTGGKRKEEKEEK
jgi:hypothetical protein